MSLIFLDENNRPMKNNILVYAIIFHHLFCLGQNSFNQNSNTLNSLLFIEQDSGAVFFSDKLSNWSYGFGMFSGYNILSNDLSDKFKNFISFGGSASIEYNNAVIMSIGLVYGPSKTKEDIMLNEKIWNKNSRANFYRVEVYLGHAVFDSKPLKIIPILGVSFDDIKTKEPNPYDFDYEDTLLHEKVQFSEDSFFLGLILDIKTANNYSSNPKSYGAIRIKYSYLMTDFENKYNMFDGNIHSITLGIGGLYRSNKKTKK